MMGGGGGGQEAQCAVAVEPGSQKILGAVYCSLVPSHSPSLAGQLLFFFLEGEEEFSPLPPPKKQQQKSILSAEWLGTRLMTWI